MSVVISASEPAAAILMESARTSAADTTAWLLAPPLAKDSSCFVRPLAIMQAFSLSSREE